FCDALIDVGEYGWLHYFLPIGIELTSKGLERLRLSKRFAVKGRERTMGTAGRPRSFDKEKALDAALQVFWRKGYEGASLAALTAAMGIEKPSMYAAFGDKEQLFRAVLDHYQKGPANVVLAALEESTARKVVERLMR